MKTTGFGLILLMVMSSMVNAQKRYPLYSDGIPNHIGNNRIIGSPDMIVYLPQQEKSTGTAVIIFPGGAYGFLALKEEGTAIAEAFANKGIAAFVVRYRLPNNETMRDKTYGPLMDAQQAIKLVRQKSREWNIDPKKVGVIGYSAGGHLASTLGTHYLKSYVPNTDSISLRPDFMILVYPVISMQGDLTHMGSRINLLGVEPDSVRVDLFSNEKQVTKETPPTYLAHCGDDQTVDVKNSIVFYESLQQHGVDAELHLYPKGDHGFTQRLPVDEWMAPMLLFLRKEKILE